MQSIQAIILVFFVLFSVSSQSDKVCLPITRDADSQSQSSQILQGRPGKVGPIGPPGDAGIQGIEGPPGQCVCDRSDIDGLKTDIQALQKNLQILWEKAIPSSTRVEICSVGVKDGRVLDEDMTSSTSYSSSYSAVQARLDSPGNKVWLPEPPAQRKGDWIQIDLKQPVRVKAIVTQGRPTTNQWVTSYKIMYGNVTTNLEFLRNPDGEEKIFQGNTDANSHVINTFKDVLVARYFRLVVESWHAHVAMRLDYLTC